MQSVIRAFIAIEINEAARAKLAAMQDMLKEAGGHVSWVQPRNIHCTLVFLGDILPPAVDAAGDALADIAAGCKPFEIEISGLGFFGSPRSPRIIWAGLTGRTDAMIELQGKITASVLRAGLNPGEKPFRPHLTIGRVRSNRNAAGLLHVLGKNRDKTFGAIAVKQVVLMESRLAAAGPAYFPLRSAALGGQGIKN